MLLLPLPFLLLVILSEVKNPRILLLLLPGPGLQSRVKACRAAAYHFAEDGVLDEGFCSAGCKAGAKPEGRSD
jgi:hypothetical protein